MSILSAVSIGLTFHSAVCREEYFVFAQLCMAEIFLPIVFMIVRRCTVRHKIWSPLIQFYLLHVVAVFTWILGEGLLWMVGIPFCELGK